VSAVEGLSWRVERTDGTVSSGTPLSDLVTPDRSAVLVQELQSGVVGAEAGLPALADAVRSAGVIERAASVLEAARKWHIPVIH